MILSKQITRYEQRRKKSNLNCNRRKVVCVCVYMCGNCKFSVLKIEKGFLNACNKHSNRIVHTNAEKRAREHQQQQQHRADTEQIRWVLIKDKHRALLFNRFFSHLTWDYKVLFRLPHLCNIIRFVFNNKIPFPWSCSYVHKRERKKEHTNLIWFACLHNIFRICKTLQQQQAGRQQQQKIVSILSTILYVCEYMLEYAWNSFVWNEKEMISQAQDKVEHFI